jgi:ABC-type uncharacterized transport system involved in gliding motility auxiliary subunit
MNSVSWAQGKKDTISVRPKNIDNYTIEVSGLSRLMASAFVVLIIPAVVLITGIIVWIKRRRL